MKKIIILLVLIPATVYGALTEKFDEDYTILGTSTGSASITMVDFNSDGKMDGVAIIDGSGSRVLAISFSGTPLWSMSTRRGTTTGTIISADLDGDGYIDDVIAGAGEVYAIGPEGNLIWSFAPDGSVYSLATADLNGDGKNNEIVVGSWKKLYALDSNGNTLWNFTDLTAGVESVTGVDLDSDGAFDGVAAVSGKMLNILDSDGNRLWSKVLSDIAYSVVAVDLDGDGYLNHIVVGCKDRNVSAFTSTGEYEWSYSAYLEAGERMKLYPADLGSRGVLNHIVIKADQVHAIGPDGTRVWPQTFPGDSVALVDFNYDGKLEGVVTGTASRIYAISPAGQQVGFYYSEADWREIKHSPYNKTGAEVALSAADLDGDGYLDDIIGIGGGAIFSIAHETLAPAPTPAPTTTPPPAMEIKVDLGPDIEVTEGATVTLTAEATPSTPTGSIQLYTWSVDGIDKSAGRDVKSFSAVLPPGTHTIKVTVIDDQNQKAEDTVTVTVKPLATPMPTTPTPTIATTTPPPTTTAMPPTEEKPISPWLYVLIGIIVGIAIVGAVAAVILRKKPEEEWAK
jgi:LysM repeat protein